MSVARIHVDYWASLTIVKEGIVEDIKNHIHHGWRRVLKQDSPFKDWTEPMLVWDTQPSYIYVGVFSEESHDIRKTDTVFLHIYNNIPMWNMEKEIKKLIEEIGVRDATLALPDYVRAVAQGALRLLEYNG